MMRMSYCQNSLFAKLRRKVLGEELHNKRRCFKSFIRQYFGHHMKCRDELVSSNSTYISIIAVLSIIGDVNVELSKMHCLQYFWRKMSRLMSCLHVTISRTIFLILGQRNKTLKMLSFPWGKAYLYR